MKNDNKKQPKTATRNREEKNKIFNENKNLNENKMLN